MFLEYQEWQAVERLFGHLGRQQQAQRLLED
jgi:hypothetical protein